MNLTEECILERLTDSHHLDGFSCFEDDLNDFLKNDAHAYSEELMGVTYLFTLATDPSKIVCFFTVSNDVLNLRISSKRNQINKPIPNEKRVHSAHYPSVKIGRLGVDQSFCGFKLGQQLMNFIKDWFLYKNKTGCRFVIVDAYNKPKVITYYQENGFDFLFSNEEEEKMHIKKDELHTRFMFFDLKKHTFSHINSLSASN